MINENRSEMQEKRLHIYEMGSCKLGLEPIQGDHNREECMVVWKGS